MALTINVLHPVFAGEVTGVDLTKPISREEAAAIEAGMDRYGVLVFRGQAITDEQQIAFTRNFGELESYNTSAPSGSARTTGWVPASPTSRTSTRTARSSPPRIACGSSSWATGCGTRTVRFGRSPPNTRCCPGAPCRSWGGNTEFADMRAAYDALDPRTKEEVEELVCEHSLLYSRQAVGFTEFTPEEIANFQPVRHPLVRVQKATGRKSLFLSAHAGAIVGWSVPSRAPSCVTSRSTRPAASSSIRIPGDGTIWWCGTTAR